MPPLIRRVLFAAISSVTLGSTSMSSAAPVAPSKPLQQQVVQDDARGWAISGVLTAPSSQSPEFIASEFLGSVASNLSIEPSELKVADSMKTAVGDIVRYQRIHEQVPVVGGDVVVRLDSNGQVRWAQGNRVLFDQVDMVAQVTSDEAQVIAKATQTPKLVVFAAGMQPRLAYQVRVPYNPRTKRADRVVVDAQTGRILSRQNLRSDVGPKAEVFPQNPTKTPIFETVDLERLDGKPSLDDGEIKAMNCLDKKTCIDGVHACVPEATARPGDDGNYTHLKYTSDTDPEDAYAEVHAYYHARKAADTLRELGHAGVGALPVVVNDRIDPSGADCSGGEYQGTAELPPTDEAFFIPVEEGAALGFAGIHFGQGEDVDYAYDAEVIYHEFGHATIWASSEEVGASAGADSQGFDPTPGSLHEGYADMLAIVVSQDPDIGEYVDSTGTGVHRTANNDNTCPRNLSGEPHHDGKILTGALWQAREAIATTDELKTKFDQAIVATIGTLNANSNLGTSMQATIMEIESRFDAAAAQTARGIFEERGALDCDRVLDSQYSAEMLMLPDPEYTPGDFGPSPIQHRIKVGGSAQTITLTADLGRGFTQDFTKDAKIVVLFKAGDAAIAWTQDGSSDHEQKVPLALKDDKFVATVNGEFQAGTYHLMLATESGLAVLNNVTVSSDDTDPAAETTEEEDEKDKESSGGCSTGGSGTSTPLLLLLAMLSAFILRRRGFHLIARNRNRLRRLRRLH